MKRAQMVVLVVASGVPLGGCATTSIDYLRMERCTQPRPPEHLEVYYSRKAVPYPYKVVAKYRVSTNDRRPEKVLSKILAKAAGHGSDAIVVDDGQGVTTTLWSWLLLFVPITEHAKVLQVSGIRYVPSQGGSE